MANDKDFLVNGPVAIGKDTKVTVGSITANDIDLSTGNYFAETLAANTTYTISNAGDVQAFQLEVTGGLGDGYALSVARYEGVSFSVAAQNALPHAIFFKPDGTKMYVIGLNTPGSVFEYNLTTAWDISTASFLQSFDVTAQSVSAKGLFFKTDGTSMYLVCSSNDEVNQYTLSTAWDVSSASYTSFYSVSAQEIQPTGLSFKPDGTKMYIVGENGDDVNEYNLSTAWSVTSASYVQNFSVLAQIDAPEDLFFKPDGTEMYIVGRPAKVNKYSLSTAWNVGTASYTESFNISEDSAPEGLFFSDSGDKLYVVGSTTDSVYQYSTGTAAIITWPSSIEWAGGVAPLTPAVGETDVFTLITDDSGTTYTGVKSIDNAS